jgi:hypothetical protein
MIKRKVFNRIFNILCESRKFIQSFPKSKPLLIGTGGIPVADFFKIEIEELF